MENQRLNLTFHHLQRTDFIFHLAESLSADRDDLSDLERLFAQRARHGFQRAVEIKKVPDFPQGETNFVISPDKQDAVKVTRAVIGVFRGSGGARTAVSPARKTGSSECSLPPHVGQILR